MKVLLDSYDNWDIVESGYNEHTKMQLLEAALPNAEKTELKEVPKKGQKGSYTQFFKVSMNQPSKKSAECQRQRKMHERFCKNHSKV